MKARGEAELKLARAATKRPRFWPSKAVFTGKHSGLLASPPRPPFAGRLSLFLTGLSTHLLVI